MKFDIINEINEAIKSIQDTSFRIRICALNSQISISNITLESGHFSALGTIASELINISEQFEKKSNELFHILYDSIQLATKERKLIRNLTLHEKFLVSSRSNENQMQIKDISDTIHWKYDSELKKMEDNFIEKYLSLKKIVTEAIKLCKYSKPIVFSVKVESVYVGKQLDVFAQLAEELSSSILKIETHLKNIQALNQELQKIG